MSRLARLCLKARPTRAQLADRLRPIDGAFPDGLELYLDAADLVDDQAMNGVVARIEEHHLPTDFPLLIEGPVGSLDGAFFDVTRDSEDDRHVIERLALLARRLGARAVNIHLIAPSDRLERLTCDWRSRLLDAAIPFLHIFVDVTRAAGAIPTIENMPPVLRMRHGGFYFTPIGMCHEDLVEMTDAVDGLEILVDSSHAGLYLNARAAAKSSALLEDVSIGTDWFEALSKFLLQLPAEPTDLLSFLQVFGPRVVDAQISNAAGLLGEGLPYSEGEFDLDPVISWLNQSTQFIVSETLEPNNDDARYMRDALRNMRRVTKQ